MILPRSCKTNLHGLPPSRVAIRKRSMREAVERFVNYDEWFISEVDKGLAAADRGEFVEHEEIGKLIDRRYPG